MTNSDRADLYKLLTGLQLKLQEISDNTDDIETQDELEKLVDVIEDSASQVMANIK